ncbi:MAG: hypothetical protein GXP27_17515 [Planctomycetes bacterium]|nr:hypothetical protein [Planctomycetota bacterium]
MLVRRTVRAEEPPWKRLTDQDPISERSRLAIHRITLAEANYIRQVYVSVDVGQAAAKFNYAVSVDGKLIGLLMFEGGAVRSFRIEGQVRQSDVAYLMADLAVASERYPRLSKLVLAASLSLEMQEELERRDVRKLRYVVTTAFSRHPASMKYRGVYKLLSRERLGDLYKLNYYAPLGSTPLQDAMRQWARKYLPAK